VCRLVIPSRVCTTSPALLCTACTASHHQLYVDDHDVDVGAVVPVPVPVARCTGPLPLCWPNQLCVAPDGVVFVADYGNKHVQVLSPPPTLDLVDLIGDGLLRCPRGVCADDTVVVVSESRDGHLLVFRRTDGALLRRIGRDGGGVGDGQLGHPYALCLLRRDRHVAVAEALNGRVSVFSVDSGDFIRHVGARVLKRPEGVACSACDELVVADTGNRCVRVFSDVGELLLTLGDGVFTGVAVHGCSVFAQDSLAQRCCVWS
jgi:DNA-binding beta-propeller fold protein YncE